MKRKEKINLLKGTASIEQRPKHTVQYFNKDEVTGLYYCNSRKKLLTEQDFFSQTDVKFIFKR